MTDAENNNICGRCGYPQRGLAPGTSCPECHGTNWRDANQRRFPPFVVATGVTLLFMSSFCVHNGFLLLILPAMVMGARAIHGRDGLGIALSIGTLVPAAAVWIAYYTVGTLGQAACCMVFMTVFPFVAWYVEQPDRSSRRIATVVLLIVSLILVPYQIVLALRWQRLHEEATAVAAFAAAQQTRTGQPPAGLQRYPWIHESLNRRIDYDVTPTGFVVYFWVADRDALRWYDSTTGWGYSPD